MDKRIVSPGPGNSVIDEYGNKLVPPNNWTFCAAGDAAVTRKITARGKYWKVQFKKGRRTMSSGVWAPKEIIDQARQAVTEQRATPQYQKQRASALKQREKKQSNYEIEFCNAVEKYLHFNERYRAIEKKMALAITAHAVPVGSGTVARTTMIPIEERASRAVIAWMRHQTTGYDNLKIAHIKGERRAVRRMLAEQSVFLLRKYRRGDMVEANCPLKIALDNIS